MSIKQKLRFFLFSKKKKSITSHSVGKINFLEVFYVLYVKNVLYVKKFSKDQKTKPDIIKRGRKSLCIMITSGSRRCQNSPKFEELKFADSKLK